MRTSECEEKEQDCSELKSRRKQHASERLGLRYRSALIWNYLQDYSRNSELSEMLSSAAKITRVCANH